MGVVFEVEAEIVGVVFKVEAEVVGVVFEVEVEIVGVAGTVVQLELEQDGASLPLTPAGDKRRTFLTTPVESFLCSIVVTSMV